ncbi:MAG TPA: hypothetical protein VNL91_07035 [Thermoanaerobaculia bacterium]|nr:hypothetical protein [Thermoanaerobaculia bacterium]
MNSRIRRMTSATLLVVCLVLTQSAFARDRDRGREPGPVSKIVKAVKKIFVPITQNDYPVPPKP